MRCCQEGHASCRKAEAGGKWCRGACEASAEARSMHGYTTGQRVLVQFMPSPHPWTECTVEGFTPQRVRVRTPSGLLRTLSPERMRPAGGAQ